MRFLKLSVFLPTQTAQGEFFPAHACTTLPYSLDRFAGNLASCARLFPYSAIATFTYQSALFRTPAGSIPDKYQPFYRGACSVMAGSIAQVCTYPLDVVRANLTVNTSREPAKSEIIPMMRHMVRTEGWRSLYKGLVPTVLCVAPFLATQTGTANALTLFLTSRHVDVTIPVVVGVGAVAGAAAQTVVYPLDTIRRRMQTSSPGQLPDSTWQALRQVTIAEMGGSAGGISIAVFGDLSRICQSGASCGCRHDHDQGVDTNV
eukprot:m.888520 g.888520  ORF g.888520 m.888520 type:complete len:261 (+) comp23638_c0_seq18:74-856(+)